MLAHMLQSWQQSGPMQTGLAGVSLPRQMKQRCVNLDSLSLIPSLPTLSHALAETAWIHRGCSDTIDAAIFQGDHRVLRGNFARDFTNHITEYSGRAFTHEEDVLKAFHGLLSRARLFTFFGVPVLFAEERMQGSVNAAFANGLWWTPVTSKASWAVPLERRSQFPSWTWAGWKGPVRYPVEHGIGAGGDDGKLMKVDDTRRHARFSIQVNDQEFHSLKSVVRTLKGKVISEVSPVLCLKATVFQLRFQRSKYGADDFCMCNCHPDSPYSAIVPSSNRWDTPCFFEKPTSRDGWYHDVTGKYWDCVLLFESTLGY
ncbi:hypothetical protein EK21DRAFT_93299 [Setomelanomma holmii]|uniref:Uncharacterized protein n=1 Tax=Setomelanomma holmii TaxID=210430 RepID=A0A9P4H162_9PLEO|nr:hypothetical protein EK21DRAFT_93299 [Setomelanomma holmii]